MSPQKILVFMLALSGAAFASPDQAVEAIHHDIGRRFVARPQGLLLDYVSADGTVQLPSDEDCRLGKPNALSWWTPMENGAFLSGLYMDGLLMRWQRTRSETDLKLARDLANGLMTCASVGTTPGFIARGFHGPDKKFYAIGSDDQTAPWFYGLWRYLQSGAASPSEYATIRAKMIAVATALRSVSWYIPCEPVGEFGPGQYRGGLGGRDFRNATRLLFIARIVYELTGDVAWRQHYETKLNETLAGGTTRRALIQQGMAGDWAATPSLETDLWIFVASQAMLSELSFLETAPDVRALYENSLQANALACAPKVVSGLPTSFGQNPFLTDWTALNSLWTKHTVVADAENIALAQLGAWHNGGRANQITAVREPSCAAWIMALAPETAPAITAATGRFAQFLEQVPWTGLAASHGLFAESAWNQLNAGTTVPATELLRDDFANGVVRNSNGIVNFWSSILPANASMTESNDKLTISSGGAGSPHGTIAAYLLSGAPNAQYNFFREKVHFSALLSVGGTVPANQSIFRFALTGASGSSYAVDDALSLMIRGDNLFSLSAKEGRPFTSAESATKLVEANAGASIIGFDLTLDATTYTLVIHRQGADSSTFTGAHGLVPAQWGVDGDSAFLLETVRSTGASAGAGQATVVSLDSFSVHRIGNASWFEDSFANGITADSDAEIGAWTMSLPDTSSAIEDSGRLVQTATSPTGNVIIANARTDVSSRFNFFDRQLKVHAAVAIDGNASKDFMKQGRLLLSSTGANAFASPDIISVGLRGSLDLSLAAKIGAPNVHLDNTNHAAIRPLIGAAQDFYVVPFSGSDRINAVDLTLNADRYRLVSYNGGAGSGLLRFSGRHGLQRAQWGANGDSCLMLDAMRTGGAAADTVATASWDDVRVDGDSTPLLDEPYWDFQATYPYFAGGTSTGSFRLWLPTTEPVIRGVILIGPGTGGDYRYMVHDPIAQETARSLGFGLIGYTNAANLNFWSASSAFIRPAIQTMLDQAAAVSGHSELSNAPLFATGNSAGAYDSTYLVRAWPERTIGFVANRGGSYSTLSAAAKKVPGLFIAGSTDVNPSTNPYLLKNLFSQWRTAGAQVAYAVSWGVEHTMRGNQNWEALWAWVVEVTNLRYPRPLAPPQTPGAWPAFLTLEDSAAYLGDNASFSSATTPSVTHPFTPVAPYASYTGAVSAASWLPSQTCARLYRALNSTDLVTRDVVPYQGPLRIVTPAQFAEPVVLGRPVTITVDPREFSATPITGMVFYDGGQIIGTDNTGPAWECSYTPSTPGSHIVSVVATNTAGVMRDAFRAFFVTPANHAPVAAPVNRSAMASTVVSGILAAADPEGNAVSFSIQSAPQCGTLTLDAATGAYAYRPAHAFVGSDSFTFVVSDGGETRTATVQLQIAARPDADGDGLPDDWESAHGVTDPATDQDGDGWSNSQEYLAGTDPRDAADALKLTLAKVEGTSGGAFTLTWPAKGGVRYRVQYGDTLTEFTDVVRPAAVEIQPGAYGEPGAASFTDDHSLVPTSSTGRRFYRVRVVQ